MDFNKTYFKQVAMELGETIAEYYKNSAENFVIIEGNKVVMWFGTFDPVIFGSIEDVLGELSNWAVIKNVSVITEKELLDTYCSTELLAALKAELIEDSVMDTSNNHNESLVEAINLLWRTKKKKFAPILKALYERDVKEIIASDAFAHFENKGEMAVITYMGTYWEKYAENYLMHIADDGDLQTIIDFIR